MIRAIVFDCFGVLTTDAWLPFKQLHFGNDSSKFERASELNRLSDAGLLPDKEFIGQIAQMAGTDERAVYTALTDNAPNTALFDELPRLKPKYKLGFLSNASSNLLPNLFSSEQIALFDAVALSYETGFTKPQEGAYLAIAQRLDVALNECLLVDDQERLITGAIEAGMQAILYTNFDDFMGHLHKALAQD